MTVRNIINIYIRAGNAEAGPPLGTVLGNLGINSLNSVKNLMNLLRITILFRTKSKIDSIY
jgi:ribosomal protein L11